MAVVFPTDPTDYETQLLGNYEAVRVQRGWSQQELAEYLRGMGEETLAARYLEQHKARRAETRGKREQATDSPTETR